MSVYFRMLFGQLAYRGLDKVDDKFKYNQFSCDEYAEILDNQTVVDAKIVNQTVLTGDQFLIVRPSANNMHEFVAQENTCFFDICLPNYSTNSLRKITYYKECEAVPEMAQRGMTRLIYSTSPPVFPPGFEINDVTYKGDLC